MKMLLKDIITEYSVKNKEEKAYPVYSVTNSQGFCKDYFGKEVASKDKSSYKVVPYGFFAYNPSRINVGSIDWQHYENKVIVSPLYNVFGVNTNLARQEYLSFYFKSRLVSDYINTLAKGTVRLNVPLSTLGSFPISIPPLSEQQRIVSELDLLSSIIEKKKAQLKEYDQLAQSIFYDMFGDLYNTKYSIKTLQEVCEFIKDGTHQTPTYTEDKVNGIMFLSAKDVVEGYINWNNIKYIPRELHEELYKRIAPQRNDLLLCKNGTTGICAIVETNAIFDIYVSLALLRPNKPYCPRFLLYAINNPYTKQQFDESLKGVGVPNLHLGEIKKAKIIYPPLAEQQQFAEKIEAIEKQKELIKQSISETETLFNSRMDYYFN
ncbi:MAG: restriction endonuclease subunit S [Bacteroidaceae bacterium]|nr:restriction endonuclease subunit S [Bacteroidaceae bacterium]